MARILMRLGKSPFASIDPVTVHNKNLIANNTGNILFGQSVFKSLYTADNEIDVNEYKVNLADVGRVNEEYDVFVIPLANAFRQSFVPQLDIMSDFISKLKIPCVVVGVGAQTNLQLDMLASSPIDAAVKKFVSAVLDRSATIGVRGDITRQYLGKLGFSAVDTIGCPSMYLNGPDLNIVKKAEAFDRNSRLSLNYTRNMPENIGQFFDRTWQSHDNASYIAQDIEDYQLLLWGRPIAVGAEDRIPANSQHPLVSSGRTKIFSDVSPWLKSMAEQDFVCGTRIHGNVFALLAGTPGYVIAHDSRTLELSEFYDIPHRRADQISAQTMIESLYEEADYAKMMANHGGRFDRYCAFLDRNGLPHAYKERKANAAFEARIETIRFHEPVGAADISPQDLVLRVAGLNELMHADMRKMGAMLKKAEKKNADLVKKLADVSDRLQKLEKKTGGPWKEPWPPALVKKLRGYLGAKQL